MRKDQILIGLILIIMISSGCINESMKTPQETPAAAIEEKNDLKTSCCQECEQAANKDPSGFDISIKDCGEYDTLSNRCSDYFKKNPIRVGHCRLSITPALN